MRVAAALAALLGCGLAAGLWSPRWVVAHFSELQGGALVVALALSVALHAAAARLPAGSPRRAEGCVVAAAAAAGGAPPSLVPLPVRFFLGAELNPRLGRLDLKQFCELQPGLLAWLFLDSCFAAVALEDAGWGPAALAARLLRLVPGSPPPPAPGAAAAPSAPFPAAVLLVLLFQLHYVCDAVWNEGAILTTMDITSDGFGFMLAFGDLVWVPFTYSLQLRYLQQQRPPPMGAALLGAVVALQGVGYAVFRGANGQKDAFRRDPSAPAVAHLVSIPTARGTRLLVSGWWGAARHVNYFGDWLMALAWCLPCGFGSALPYFYAAYFAVLLAHRERRDERHCAHKYGAVRAGEWAG